MNEFRILLGKRITPLLVAGVAGLAGGVLAGRGTRIAVGGSREASQVAGVTALPGRADAPARAASPVADAEDRMARLFAALKEPIYLAKRHALREALRGFPASEFPRLVERGEKVPADLKADLLVAVMIAWCDADPAAANRWMLDHPDWSWGVEAWARKNPQDAIRDALAAPERDRSKKALFSAIEKLVGKDPAAMAARLRELPTGGLRDTVFADVLDRWAKNDPAAAFAAASELAPGAGRNDARKKVVLAWANRDPAAALAQIPEMLPRLSTGVLGSTFLAQLAEGVMKRNPRLALDWLGGLLPEHRSGTASRVSACGRRRNRLRRWSGAWPMTCP